MLILGVFVLFVLAIMVCVIIQQSDQRWNQKMFSEQADIIDRIIGFLPGVYIHMPDGCEDDGCPCRQRKESQR